MVFDLIGKDEAMIRCSVRMRGVKFYSDCPDYIKARSIGVFIPAALNGEKHSLPLCDQEWVSLVDEKILGWWFPLVGFVSDRQITEKWTQLIRILHMKN